MQEAPLSAPRDLRGLAEQRAADALACAAELRHLALAVAPDVGSLEHALKHDTSCDASCVVMFGPPLDDDEASDLVARLAPSTAKRASWFGTWLMLPAPMPVGAHGAGSAAERNRAFRTLLEVAAVLRRAREPATKQAASDSDVRRVVRAAEMLEGLVAAPLMAWLRAGPAPLAHS